ncbi:CGNR zinc finger domain-containing protein [Streptomyces sp. NPDC002851]
MVRFDSGRACLDLLATAHPEERLDGPDALRDWLARAGLVPGGTPLGGLRNECVGGFRELRGDIGQMIRVAVRGLGPASRPYGLDNRADIDAALDRLNARAATAPPAPRAVRHADGDRDRDRSLDLIRVVHPAPDCAALLAAVARDAVELLTDPVARSRIRQCQGDNCPLLYLDTSRGHRRRWCSSEVCGNRERVARHRRRSGVAKSL